MKIRFYSIFFNFHKVILNIKSPDPKSDTNLDETPLRKKLLQIFYFYILGH